MVGRNHKTQTLLPYRNESSTRREHPGPTVSYGNVICNHRPTKEPGSFSRGMESEVLVNPPGDAVSAGRSGEATPPHGVPADWESLHDWESLEGSP